MTDAPRPPRRWPQLVLWLLVTVAVVAAARALPWTLALQHMARAELVWLAVAVMANLAILPLWAAEWRLLAPRAAPVSFARMFEVVSVSAAVLNSVPFLAGEVSAVALLITRARLARSAALAVLALDQLLVGLAKLTVLLAAAAIAPLPSWLRAGVFTLAAAVILLLAVLLPLAHGWESVRARLLRTPSVGRRLAARVSSWGRHLDLLREAPRLSRAVVLALLKKTAELLAILAIQVAFGMNPTVAGALLVLAALAVTTLLPVMPGNLGVYEATVFATYRFVGVPAELALGLAIVQHVAFLLPPLATGYLMLSLGQARPQRQPAA